MSKQPQTARSLERVISTVLAVAGGARTTGEIAELLNISDREGRWLRDAALALGLLTLTPAGQAEVTQRAARILAAKDQLQQTARLRHALRQMPAIRDVLAYLQQHPLGCTVRKLEEVVEGDWPLDESTLQQRVEVIVAWLKEVELISEQNGVVRPVDALAQR